MKNYTITVNGNVYEVTVEEGISAQAPVQAQKEVKKSAPTVKPVQKPAAPAGAQGEVKVNSPMPGKILAISAAVGKSVKRGEVLMVLEAMKMENEIVAPQDGTVASLNTSVNATVEAGDLLATLN